MDGEYSGDSTQLLYLRARYYNPYLNQFTQPDSIVPDPYNPQDWNRYSYVRNNPIRYNDPSGHMVTDDKDGGLTIEGYTYVIERKFQWKLEDKFSLEEVKTIYQTGYDIETHVNGLTEGRGLEWMLSALGNITITHGDIYAEHSETWPTWHGPKIWLGKGWLNDGGWDSKQLFAHELGHVWDIRSWSSKSTRLHANLGGVSALFPFFPPDRYVPRWDPVVNTTPSGDAYGNGAINEYFAEAFSWTIYGGLTPPGVAPLINGYITEEVSYYPD